MWNVHVELLFPRRCMAEGGCGPLGQLGPGYFEEKAGAPLPGLTLLPSVEIARHFRFGNQEDAHEFLRYTVDAMQKACLSSCAK